MIIILSRLFLLWAVQKHGYKSVPDSIAGLSESGANAEHTGKSCSRLELVVRECGLMLQRMVSVFLFCCHTFLRICRIRFNVPGPWDIVEGNQEPVYRDSWLPVCQSCIPAGIFAIYMTDGNRILPWSFLISFSIHLYCISPSFLQPLLKILPCQYAQSCFSAISSKVQRSGEISEWDGGFRGINPLPPTGIP